MVENNRDEMFRLMSTQMSQWKLASKTVTVGGKAAAASKGN